MLRLDQQMALQKAQREKDRDTILRLREENRRLAEERDQLRAWVRELEDKLQAERQL